MATYLVYAAAGERGRPIAQGLLDRGHVVRALRPTIGTDATDLVAAGITVVQGSLDDPTALARASDGVDGVHLQLPVTTPPPLMLDAVRRVAAAAADGGATAIVFTTNAPVLADVEGGSLGAMRAAADLLLAGTTPATVLMPTLYLANLAGPWTMPAILHQGVLPYPVPADQPVAWLAPEGAAAFAIAALEREAVRGMTLPMAGAEAVVGPDLATKLGAALGRPVHYAPISGEDFEASLAGPIGPQAAADVARVYRMGEAQGAPWLTPNIGETSRLLGVAPALIDTWIGRQAWLSSAQVGAGFGA